MHIVGHWNYPQLSDDTYNYPLKSYNGTYWEETGEYGKRDPKNKTVYVIGSAGLSKVELYVNDKLKVHQQSLTAHLYIHSQVLM